MTAGDTVTANNATAGNGTWTIQPSAGVEWVLHEVAFSGACKIQKTDGSTVVVLYQPLAANASPIPGIAIHLTNGVYLQMVDTSSATNNMGYDGVQTK